MALIRFPGPTTRRYADVEANGVERNGLQQMKSPILGSALQGAAFFCSQAAYSSVFARLAASAGGHVARYMPGLGVVPIFLGYPIVVSVAMPTTPTVGGVVAFFGDLSMGSVMVTRRSIQINQSWQNPPAYDTDSIKFRSTMRAGIVNHSLGPMAVLLGAFMMIIRPGMAVRSGRRWRGRICRIARKDGETYAISLETPPRGLFINCDYKVHRLDELIEHKGIIIAPETAELMTRRVARSWERVH
jgi:hypothetical protein